MSSRPQFSPDIVISAGDMSGNITSSPTIIQKLSMISYSLSWNGSTPVGAASVQVSNDYALNANGTVKNAGTWTTITLSVNGSTASSVPISGNTGTAFIDIDQIAAYAIRLLYTSTSGTGSLTAVINGKVA